jgi:hypothetical protein
VTYIDIPDVRAWLEPTKFPDIQLDPDFLPQIEEEVIARIRSTYDTTTWVTPTTTPRLVRTAIAKLYAAWTYNKVYSEDNDETNNYATRLMANAEKLISGIVDGTIELPTPATPVSTNFGVAFYPTDLSSSEDPDDFDDPSLGPAVFSMGMKF